MATIRLSEADHARVTASVARAEQGTDGEIVTIVTGHSDDYRDIAFIWAVAAMLFTLGAIALFPGVIEAKLDWMSGGWRAEGDAEAQRLLLFVLAAELIVYLVVRYALSWDRLRFALTPRAVKSRRVRRRAVQFFRASAEKRTATRVGILLYLSLDEHVAEIVADEAIHHAVPPERWGDAMAALVDKVREGDPAGGMVAAVDAIGDILHAHVPASEDNPNELPDRLIEL